MNHKHGGDIYRYEYCIDFSSNCNPLGTPQSVKQAVCEAVETVHHYPDVECEALTKRLAEYENADASWVCCGNGAADVIFSLCLAYKPQKALLPAPTFAEYQQALESVGCEIIYHYLSKEQGFGVTEDILEAVTQEIDIVFLCNPNNPTGLLTKRELMLKLLDKCRQTDTLLVVDECFLDFVKKPEEYTLKGVLSQYENLFILKAFTKRYAIAGIRLGYGLTSNQKLLQTMREVTQPWNVSTLAQAAGLAALEEEEYVQKGRALIFEEQEYLKNGLKSHGLKYADSCANYIFFQGPKDLWEKCVAQGILIRDCSNYPGLESGYYRIAVRTHEENEKLLHAFSQCIQQ